MTYGNCDDRISFHVSHRKINVYYLSHIKKVFCDSNFKLQHD